MPVLSHIHSFVRYKKKNTNLGLIQLYRCSDPHCTYKVDRDFIVGKACKCSCGREFILSYADLQRAFPKCLNCSNTIEAKHYKLAKSIARSILPHEDESEDLKLPEHFQFVKELKEEPEIDVEKLLE